MNNFGVIEVASTKTRNAPGWAYVPDVGPSHAASLQPTHRKRAARNQNALSLSDLSARQNAKIRKDLETLDRDIHKDSSIPIPTKSGASRAQSKTTPNVRKILQSQKTFANHLDDYQALVILAETNPAAAAALTNAAPPKPAAPSTSARNSPAPSATPSVTSKRSAVQAKRAALAAANEKKEAAKKAVAAKSKAEAEAVQETRTSEDDDVEMVDAPAQESSAAGESTPRPASAPNGDSAEPRVQPAPQIYPPDGTILPPYKRPPPPTHPGDNDPLLVSYVPGFPTDDELRALMTAPPLNYLEARASWSEEENRYPHRSFCEVCGYWGRVRCMKCGSRACALDCLNTHKDECERRYGL